MPEGRPFVMQRRLSFLSILVLGATATIITAIVAAAVLFGYGIKMFDRKTDGVLELGRHIVSNAPELMRSLPPVLADAISDHRDPGYVSKLAIDLGTGKDSASGAKTATLMRIKNEGQEVVSLLAVRVVLVDEDGDVVSEWTEMVATPLALDHDMAGPLLPGQERTVGINPRCLRGVTADISVADVRIWDPVKRESQGGEDRPAAEVLE